MSEIEVEVVKRAVLHAQSPQCRPVNLSCQVLQEEPGGAGARGAAGAKVGGGGGGATVAPTSGAAQTVGGRPASDGGGRSLLLGRLGPGLAPEVLSHFCQSVGAGAGRQSPGILRAGRLLGGRRGEAPGGGAERVVGVRSGAGRLLGGCERGDYGAGGDAARGHGGVLGGILHLSCPLPSLAWNKLRNAEVVIVS